MIRTSSRRRIFCCGTAIASLFMADAAAAQDARTVEANSDTQLEEITVTANKRGEPMQNVPVAVTAISSSLATAVGITDVSSIQTAVPGLQIPRLYNAATPALRGIGTGFAVGPQESVVAFYLDDVYISSPAATTFALNNISQVEVLKGPQGTVFGRNAMAGVINITTRSPGPDTVVDASVGYANYNTVSGSFYGSAPLTSTLGVDLAVSASKQNDGWGKNLYDGSDVFKEKFISARSKIVFDPDPQSRFRNSG